jgi:fatty acid desaturase
VYAIENIAMTIPERRQFAALVLALIAALGAGWRPTFITAALASATIMLAGVMAFLVLRDRARSRSGTRAARRRRR